MPRSSKRAARSGRCCRCACSGRLDQELSCANSRFFRRLLYPEPRINQLLRDKFVLHWQSVRPVPVVTIDFGDGRTLQRTLTGNSLHVVLDGHGRPVDALPGLVGPDVFIAQLQRAHAMALASRDRLSSLHARAMRTPVQPPPIENPCDASEPHRTDQAHGRSTDAARCVAGRQRSRWRYAHEPRAARAHPRGVRDRRDVDGRRARRLDLPYLFLMPPSDPALGLDVAEPFQDFSYA